MYLRRLACLMTLLPLACGGCALVGVVADKIANGPQPIEAQYDPGKTSQLLVIAENYRAPTLNASDADRLARLVSDQLEQKKVALIVSQEKLALVRDAKPGAFNKMSVVDVGNAVGATKILYIDLLGVGVGVQTGSDVLKGIGHANVKLINVRTGEVEFPKDMSDGMPISHETAMRRATDKVNAQTVRTEALIGLSLKISRLFYRYEPSDMEALDPEPGT